MEHSSRRLNTRSHRWWYFILRHVCLGLVGSGFKVAIALWFLSGLNRQARTVKLSGKVLREMGVGRHAGYRGLDSLEKAGLVSVERRPGQSPLVTLLEKGEEG